MTDIPQPYGPAAHKAAARQLGIPRNSAKELRVLTADNDPFYAGMPYQKANAEWFAGMLDRFGLQLGAHMRRVHYRMITSREPVTLPDGTPYLNTDAHWSRLLAASAHARILGLVDPESMVDARNDPVIENALPWQAPSEPRILQAFARYVLPELPYGLNVPDIPDFDNLGSVEAELYGPSIGGYWFHPGEEQPVMIEVWCEKSTQADILKPLCDELHLNYLEGTGHESITQHVIFLRRAQQHGSAAHILYVSDFDPGGENMPVAAARQLQFWMEKLEIDVKVSVDPLVLTHEQCVEFELPRIPLKKDLPGKTRWEERYGEGATELDALEALHPGELARIIRRGSSGSPITAWRSGSTRSGRSCTPRTGRRRS